MSAPTSTVQIDPAFIDEYLNAQRKALSEAVSQWVTETKSFNDINRGPVCQALQGKIDGRTTASIADVVVSCLLGVSYTLDHLSIRGGFKGLSYEGSGHQETKIRASVVGDVNLLSLVMERSPAPFELLRKDRDNDVRFTIQGPFSAEAEAVKRTLGHVEHGFAQVNAYLKAINAAVKERQDAAGELAKIEILKHVEMLKANPDVDAVMTALGIRKAIIL